MPAPRASPQRETVFVAWSTIRPAVAWVAGHAGLFSSAEDLAKFARAILRGNVFPRQMTEVVSPPEVAIRRAGGFDIDSSYARPRGEHFPIGMSFGHTGWTGGFLWIVP